MTNGIIRVGFARILAGDVKRGRVIFRSACAYPPPPSLPELLDRTYRCQNIRAWHSDAWLAGHGGAITRPARKNFAKSEIRENGGGGRGWNIAPGMPGLRPLRGEGGGGGAAAVYSDIASQRVYGEVTHHPRIVSLNGISI